MDGDSLHEHMLARQTRFIQKSKWIVHWIIIIKQTRSASRCNLLQKADLHLHLIISEYNSTSWTHLPGTRKGM